MCALTGMLSRRGVDRHTGQEVAVKILAKTRSKSTREKTLKKIWREAACLSAVQVRFGHSTLLKRTSSP